VSAAEVSGARAAPLPQFVPPQLATLVKRPPAGDAWLHEMKFDGYRILARLHEGRVTLMSRNGREWTEQFPSVVDSVRGLSARAALLDGEVAVVTPDGRTSFQALQNYMNGSHRDALVYMLFDLLHLDGQDLTGARLADRKAALARLLGPRGEEPGVLRYSDHVVGSGAEFFAEACRLGLEGVVSKRRDAPYRSTRGADWVKTKCVKRQEVVIGGYTDPEGSRLGIGALLAGVYDDGRLVYVGKVGTGFTARTLQMLHERLKPLERPTCAFATRPTGVGRPHWVEPRLVAEVAFGEWTADGRMRHPSFQGLREDKPADQVVRERPVAATGAASPAEPAESAAAPASRGRRARRPASSAGSRPSRTEKGGAGDPVVAGVRLTHADRVLYPAQGTTKLDLARFYESIAEWILPHLVDRPTTLVRCPEGAHRPCFYQKHTGYWAPDTLRRVAIEEKKKTGEYLVVDDLPGLIGLVQIGILEIHTWNAKVARLETPDRLVFDLDPAPDVPFARVMDAARRVRAALRADGREGFVKTTGGKGLHVVTPLVPGASWAECAAYAEALAVRLAGEAPEAFVATMSKARRKGRIYIDWLRNVRGATSIASFSTRARAGAPVSVPLRWDELTADLRPDAFTVESVPRRLRARRADPWAGYEEARRPLRAAPAGRDRPPRPRTRRKAAGRK
jgi:bifunctional non-homologous end joining protein LigD